ncbi:DUF202 domain-containing protein [Escherichia coli]|nr:DUF202 domain-containing protein [Escherichia coli]
MKISRLGEAPDYRFSLANERTFLAWIRTALGFLAAGVGLDQLAPDFATPVIRELLALLLCLFSGGLAMFWISIGILAIVALILWHYTRNRNLMDVTNSDFSQFHVVRDKFLISLAVLSLAILFAVTHIHQLIVFIERVA